MSPAADRNLLFGILALQMDFITRDQLVAAMGAWVLDKAKPLGRILVEQKALRDDLFAALDTMVQKHVEVHNNDAQQSLASLSSVGSARQVLDQIADPAVQASLAHFDRQFLKGMVGDEHLLAVADRPTIAHPSAHGAEDASATKSHSVGDSTSAGQRFRILRPHAEGGLGRVSVARDEELGREVALKEIKERYADDPASRSRFLLEAEITGGLEHPGIVPVYSLGNYADGRPFYAMRFIRGDSLKEAIDHFHRPKEPRTPVSGTIAKPLTNVRGSDFTSLDFRKLLGRFNDVCNAIAYAHSRGVLHRDLKPGNIMLGKYGETLVVDWGLGKLVERTEPDAPASDAAEQTLKPASASGSVETIAGQALGTPAYMSPEQAAGRIDLLGPASDVYSLGATLYSVLTGRAPFEGSDIGVMLANVQMGEFLSPRRLKPGIDPALDAICLKAMAVEPQHRYATPRLLADDIEHWLADEPVTAWPEPWTVKSRRWVGRHRVLVTGAAAALLVAVISSITANLLLSEANETITQREKETREAGEQLAKSNEEIKLANLKLAKEQKETELARQAAQKSAKEAADRADAEKKAKEQIENDLATSTMQLARSRFEENNAALADDLLEQVPDKPKYRGAPWRLLKNYVAGSAVSLRGHKLPVTSVAFSPDDQTLASGGIDNMVKLWDARTGQELRNLRGHQAGVMSVAFSPDGQTLASGSEDNTVKLWDARTGQELRSLRGHQARGHQAGVMSVAFSPDGQTLASGSQDNTVKLWDARTGQELRSLRGHQNWISSVVFNPDGQTLASGGIDNTVKLWDARTGQELRNLRGHQDWVTSVAFSPDGQRLASGSRDKTVKLWDARTGQQLRSLRGHQNWVTSVAISPDGQTLASGSEDNTIKLWDARTSQEPRNLRGHKDLVTSVAFSPDGQTLVSACWDSTVKLWDARTDQELRSLRGHQAEVKSVAFSPDGRTLASGSRDSTVMLRDARTGQEFRSLRGHQGAIASVAFSPNGRTLASGTENGTVTLWDARTGQKLFSGRNQAWVMSVAFSPDGQTVAWGSDDNTVKLWDAHTGQEPRSLRAHQREVASVAFSPDGQTLASGSYDMTIKLWDPGTGQELRSLLGHQNEVASVAFSPDSQTLASGSYDKTVKLWDARTGQELRSLRGHQYSVLSVAFSPDSQTLASGSFDQTVKLWDARTGQELRSLRGHQFGVTSVAFSPDGQTLASGSGDGTVKLWDARTGQDFHSLRGHQSRVWALAFSPDGATVYGKDLSKKVLGWESKTGNQVEVAQANFEWGGTTVWSPDRTLLAQAGAAGLIQLVPKYPSAAEQRFRNWRLLPDPAEHRRRAEDAERDKQGFGAASQLGHFLSARERFRILPWDPSAIVHLVSAGAKPGTALTGYVALEDGRRARTAFVDGATFAGILLKDSGRSPKGLVLRAQWAVDQWPEGWQNREVLGGALYRDGDYRGAVRELTLSHKLRAAAGSGGNGKTSVFSCHFLALAHHKLGNANDAAIWRMKAVLPKDANWEDAMIDRYLRPEVEAELK